MDCEEMGCCPVGWSCRSGSLLPLTFNCSFSSPIVELNFLRWKLLWSYVGLSNWLQVSMVWGKCGYRTYCFLASNGIYGCCSNGDVCSEPVGDPATTIVTPTFNPPSTTTINISQTPTTTNCELVYIAWDSDTWTSISQLSLYRLQVLPPYRLLYLHLHPHSH